MTTKRKVITFFFTIMMIAFLILLFIVQNSTISFSNLDTFKNEIRSKHSFIKGIDMHGNSPTLFISFKTNRTIDLEEAKSVFETTKSILFSNGMLQQVIEAHQKKYGGTTARIIIVFNNSKDDGKEFVRFKSYSEDFSKWFIDQGGIVIEYQP